MFFYNLWVSVFIIILKMAHKCLIFVLTVWSYAALQGTSSAFAMTKEPMSQDLSITQTFLGLVDSITIMGTILGGIFMVYLTRGIRAKLLIFSLIHGLFFSMMILSEDMSHPKGRALIIISMFIVGIAKASLVFPQILFSNFFDPKEQKFFFNLWYAFTFLGDTCGILISKYILTTLQLHWGFNLVFFSAILLLASLLICFLINQPQTHEEGEQHETVGEILDNIKEFLKPTANKLITADFALEQVLYNDIILWMPLAYELNNLAGQDYIATVSFPLMILLGALIVEYLLTFCEDKSKYFLTAMIFINCINFLAMVLIDLNRDTVWVHVVILSFSGLIMGAPYARVSSGDPAEVCQNDPKKIHTAFFTINFTRYVTSGVTFFLIGYFLEKNKSALQIVNFITAFLILVVGFLRRFVYPPDLGNSQSEDDSISNGKESLSIEKEPIPIDKQFSSAGKESKNDEATLHQ